MVKLCILPKDVHVHDMVKLCILPKDVHVMAIETDVEQLWSLLKSSLEIMDELCVAGKNRKRESKGGCERNTTN